MEQEVYLTSAEVQERLQIGPRTLTRLMSEGQLRAYKISRLNRFKLSEIEAWMRLTRRQTVTSAAVKVRSRPRALVVDDEEAVRDLVARALVRGDYEVDTAPEGTSALALLHERTYDVLITDLRMPGLDGLSMIREARRLSSTLAVVIMTAYSTEQYAIDAINLGVVGYLIKPFRSGNVLSAANRALGVPTPATL